MSKCLWWCLWCVYADEGMECRKMQIEGTEGFDSVGYTFDIESSISFFFGEADDPVQESGGYLNNPFYLRALGVQ